jgi:hypothetical protein
MLSRRRTWDPDARAIADMAILLDVMVGAPIPSHQAEDAGSAMPPAPGVLLRRGKLK